uniref:non-specific serine/threonine protein kinase n=1 Tax=Helianthus annuus TaxID=4232 RepID=A0A251UVU5_HELAN
MKAVPADFQSPRPSLNVFKFADLEKATRLFSLERPSPSLNVFKFADLEKATRMFSLDLLLGEGGFGKVFLGWAEQNTLAPSKQGVGIAVVVKRFYQEGLQGLRQWLTEVNFLGHMDHPNIIRLLGYCNEEHEHLLVYEYMPNKSFEHCLFTGLSWETRLLIMIGVVRGLTYLHSMKLMCRGLKTGDILLDEDFNAKLRDFGLVKYGPEPGETHVTTMVMRTYGYAAPEYVTTGMFCFFGRKTGWAAVYTAAVFKKNRLLAATVVFTGDNRSIASEQYRRCFTGDMSPLKVNSGDKRGQYRRRLSPLKVPYSCSHLTMKCDIYSLGVVLVESITGRRAMDRNMPTGQENLVEWASRIKSTRKLDKIMDPRLEHNYPIKGASECFALALRCVSNKPKDRPSSEEVLQSLERIYALHK